MRAGDVSRGEIVSRSISREKKTKVEGYCGLWTSHVAKGWHAETARAMIGWNGPTRGEWGVAGNLGVWESASRAFLSAGG